VSWRVLACVIATGCGRLGFQPPSDGRGDRTTGDGSGMPGDGVIADTIDLDAAAGACGTMVALSDDFADGVTGAQWTTLTGTNIALAETGGDLQITFASNVSAGQTAGYQSVASFDFTGSCVDAEIASTPNAATLANMTIRIGTSTDCGVIEIYSGMIHAAQHRGASISTLPAFAFDALADRFLRMREVSGSWYYQSSPDGTTWTTFGAVANMFPLQTSTTVRFTAGTNSGVSNGGVAAFAGVNVALP
jgi:hypothetical protein